MCCAPCATFPVETLKEKGIDLEGLFYNPNIHPFEEFKRREAQVKKLSEIYNIKVHFMPDFNQQIWEELKDKSKNRCNGCYNMRLSYLFKFAKMGNFDAVTTSLLVSPYQNHGKLKELAIMYSQKYGIPFYYEDFRLGYKKGQEKAKALGFYKQRYCGCVISLLETINQISLDEKRKREAKND